MTTPVTRWWWLRHAPVPDPENRICGQLDPPCDLSDQQSMAALAALLPKKAVIVESGLLRCSQTLGAIEAAGLPMAPALIEAALQEQDFGYWQGRRWADLESRDDPQVASFWQDPASAAPPGGESFVTLVARVQTTVHRLTREFQGRDIIAIAHAGTIRAALQLALGLTPRAALSFVIDPLSVTRLDAIGDGWRVGGVNMPPALPQ
jgi:alpha-ribazole phosphatase